MNRPTAAGCSNARVAAFAPKCQMSKSECQIKLKCRRPNALDLDRRPRLPMLWLAVSFEKQAAAL